MRLAIEVLTFYIVYLLGTSLLIWRYGSRDRGPSIVVSAVAPILLVAVFVELLVLALAHRIPSISPCPVGLSDAESVVEQQRRKMFGGNAVEPHFASDWARLYAQTLELDAERVQSFARRVLSIA